MEKIKALALLSGGLDSTLAIKVVQEQGIEVEALNYVTAFCQCTSNASCKLEALKASETLGVKIRVINSSREFLEVVKAPKHGYGSNMNPCIDCRIQMFKSAAEYMKKSGAKFLITGEVLGQRPMSQRREAMRLIDKETGLAGLILRPLSARFLEPTIPEKEGWIDREKLPAIKGRSRKQQFQLADLLEIKDYPCPAGGCLLTDPEFAHRLRDLMAHAELTLNDVHLLKVGRHFRLDPHAKAIVGRNERDNEKIFTLCHDDDLLFEVTDVPGPTTLLRTGREGEGGEGGTRGHGDAGTRGEESDSVRSVRSVRSDGSAGTHAEENVRLAAALTALYAKAQGAVKVQIRRGKTKDMRVVEAEPLDSGAAKRMIIVKNNEQ